MRKRFIYWLLPCLLGITACNSEQKILDYTNLLNLEGKEIYFSPEVKVLPCMKILVYIDADCSSCFVKLSKWDELLRSNPLLSVTGRVVFILGTSNKLMAEYYLEKLNFKHPYTMDTTSLFLIENNLSDIRKHTLLLNETNHCMLAGDPVSNKQALNLFLKKLSYEN